MGTATPHARTSKPMGIRTLRIFFIATFAISWGVGVLVSVFPDRPEAPLGPMGNTNPAFILIVYTPAIVAIALVARHFGIRGLGRFFRRLTLWRMPAVWWLLLLVGLPAVSYTGAAVKGTLGDPFPFSPWYSMVPALILALLIGPIEEFGWRGVALPLLQRRWAPLSSAIISLLVAVLFHAQINGPAWPDAQPWDMYLFVVVAIVVVIVNRKAMLSRDGAATAVLIDGHEPVAAST